MEDIINEEIEAYFAINGKIGGWGEDMNDSIAVDVILENIESGHDIAVTKEIEGVVRNKLDDMKRKDKFIEKLLFDYDLVETNKSCFDNIRGALLEAIEYNN